ncbi:MAG: peptidylprolyl isomerase [Eubacteriales bacterium]|nr:peptidylprolyl isomerase [Eubacteriales bacterium]
MKKLVKRTAVTALAGVMAAGMLAGCGEKTLDGTKTVATVDGTEIPMGVLSLMARQQQASTESMYLSFMGSIGNIWDAEVDEESGETYGQQARNSVLEQLELMCIMKEKASDYNVEVTDEDQTAIAEAAATFMEANTEETLKELAVTEDQVKMLLELQTYYTRMYDAIVAEADTEVSDEEAQQSGFTYVSVSTSGDELTEEDIAEKKEQAQEILDQMKEDPEADMDEVAKGVDDTYSALEGNFTTNIGEDEEEDTSYPEEVIAALRELEEGEVAPELIETDSSYYIVRLDSDFDEEATESEKESIVASRKTEYYTETTDKWLEDADITVDEKVLETLTITDSHSFSVQTPEEETSEDAAEVTEDAEETDTEETSTEETDAEETDTAETDADEAGNTEETGDTEAAESEEDSDTAVEETEDTEAAAESEAETEDEVEETDTEK